MVTGFIIVATVALIAFLAIVAVKTDDHSGECTTDIPCQECGACYGDHFNASLTNGHTYVYPRDLHR